MPHDSPPSTSRLLIGIIATMAAALSSVVTSYVREGPPKDYVTVRELEYRVGPIKESVDECNRRAQAAVEQGITVRSSLDRVLETLQRLEDRRGH